MCIVTDPNAGLTHLARQLTSTFQLLADHADITGACDTVVGSKACSGAFERVGGHKTEVRCQLVGVPPSCHPLIASPRHRVQRIQSSVSVSLYR